MKISRRRSTKKKTGLRKHHARASRRVRARKSKFQNGAGLGSIVDHMLGRKQQPSTWEGSFGRQFAREAAAVKEEEKRKRQEEKERKEQEERERIAKMNRGYWKVPDGYTWDEWWRSKPYKSTRSSYADSQPNDNERSHGTWGNQRDDRSYDDSGTGFEDESKSYVHMTSPQVRAADREYAIQRNREFIDAARAQRAAAAGGRRRRRRPISKRSKARY